MSIRTDIVKRSETLPAELQQALEAHGLTSDALRCEMEMASGTGFHQPRSIRWTITYNLPLCRFCGRANPQEVCPEKVKRLLNAG